MTRMGFGEQIAGRLKRLRREQRLGQEVVARAVGTSISAVSRLERGLRSLRVNQLAAWAGALGLRVDVVIWAPTFADEAWDDRDATRAMGLDDECAAVLAEVASAVAHLPGPARQALVRGMKEWRAEARKQRGVPE